MKSTSFRDLEVWQVAHQLVLMVYKTTVHFPVEERFGLMQQLRRAAVSVSANLVEGLSATAFRISFDITTLPKLPWKK